MSPSRSAVVQASKAALNLAALVVVFPAALSCWIEERWRPGSEAIFGFLTHVLALMPGLPGLYLRRAFYHLTLRSCSLNCWIDFGVLFAHRTADVEDGTYIGAYSVIGSARLRKGCLIGTRANLLSGSAQHELQVDGRWSASDAARYLEIEIGENAWVGEGAIVMADVGAGAQIAAGSVVAAAVPTAIVVAGNPARFVRSTGYTGPVTSPGPQSDAGDGYLGFIDWLKCLGILIIAYGHLAGWAPLASLPPIYAKQIGVALFLFVAGFSLNREGRRPWHVAFNRLFEVFVLGLMLAFTISAVSSAAGGRPQISNYAPFVLGVNVLFDFFPANPTTWFLGTYIHAILLWALVVRRIRVTPTLLVVSIITEVSVRAVLMQTAGGYVAYMALPNWLTVFMLGCWYGQRRETVSPALTQRAGLCAGILLAILAAVWPAVTSRIPFEPTFPFMHLPGYGAWMRVTLTSALVSGVYLGSTWLVFLTTRAIPATRPVRFIARNTLVIFLAHMPILFLIQPTVMAWGLGRFMSSVIFITLCVPGLAWLSEFIHRGGRPRAWRDWAFARLQAWMAQG